MINSLVLSIWRVEEYETVQSWALGIRGRKDNLQLNFTYFILHVIGFYDTSCILLHGWESILHKYTHQNGSAHN